MHLEVIWCLGEMRSHYWNDTALAWDILKAKFEIDFQAAPTTSKLITKLPEWRQQDHKNVNKYVSRCSIILADLKNKVSIENQEFILNWESSYNKPNLTNLCEIGTPRDQTNQWCH